MRTFDTRAWLVWLIAGGSLAIVLSNPFYLLLLFLSSRVVQVACAPRKNKFGRFPFWRVSIAIVLFSILFNALTAHVGQTVIIELPSHWWLIGGSITLEAAAYGFINGLRLVTLLSFFTVFNQVVPVGKMAGLMPGALNDLGLVLLIAITYIPETARQFNRIRDAQAIRGHRLRGIRSWRPILIPLLIAGLERAFNLAETMISRGYGSTSQMSLPRRIKGLFTFGLVIAFGGALRLTMSKPDGWILLACGAILIAGIYRQLGTQQRRTSYRPNHWRWSDSLVVVGVLLSLSPLLLAGTTGYTFSPYPRLQVPPLTLWISIAVAGFVLPAVLCGTLEQGVKAWH